MGVLHGQGIHTTRQIRGGLMDYKVELTKVARYAAHFSPDPSSQNAAVLVPEGAWEPSILTASVNEFPQRVRYSDERWERPIKYSYIEHAERNAIYFAARYGVKTRWSTMICLWAACPDCARAIIQADILRLVTLRPTEDGAHSGWDDGIKLAMDMLHESGVKVEYIDGPLGVTVRRNGKDFLC